jgi:hypothetical protein
MAEGAKKELYSRRGFLEMSSAALAAAGVLPAVEAAAQEQKPYPSNDDRSAIAPGPGNSALDAQNPDSFLPLLTDAAGVLTFKYPFGPLAQADAGGRLVAGSHGSRTPRIEVDCRYRDEADRRRHPRIALAHRWPSGPSCSTEMRASLQLISTARVSSPM